MTREEAGQIVLEGDPWLACQTCDGDGWQSYADGVVTVMVCSDCCGFQTVIRPIYKEACVLLDLCLPKRPITFLCIETIEFPPGLTAPPIMRLKINDD